MNSMLQIGLLIGLLLFSTTAVVAGVVWCVERLIEVMKKSEDDDE